MAAYGFLKLWSKRQLTNQIWLNKNLKFNLKCLRRQKSLANKISCWLGFWCWPADFFRFTTGIANGAFDWSILLFNSYGWPHRLGVRTPDSHSGNPGSSPGEATKTLLLLQKHCGIIKTICIWELCDPRSVSGGDGLPELTLDNLFLQKRLMQNLLRKQHCSQHPKVREKHKQAA